MAKSTSEKLKLVGWAALAIASLAVILYFLLFTGVAQEDYKTAAKDAQQISEQNDAFTKAAQKYIALANTTFDPATARTLDASLQNSLAQILEAKKEISSSAALRDFQVKQAYDDYATKAEKSDTLYTSYVKTIPLYADMYSSCRQISQVDETNIFKQLQIYAEKLQVRNKVEALAVFDKQMGECLAKSQKLKDAGSDTFADTGAIFYTTLTSFRQSLAARYDEAAKLGNDAATERYEAALEEAVDIAAQSIAKAKVKQDEAATFDYAEEIKKLHTTLEAKVK